MVHPTFLSFLSFPFYFYFSPRLLFFFSLLLSTFHSPCFIVPFPYIFPILHHYPSDSHSDITIPFTTYSPLLSLPPTILTCHLLHEQHSSSPSYAILFLLPSFLPYSISILYNDNSRRIPDRLALTHIHGQEAPTAPPPVHKRCPLLYQYHCRPPRTRSKRLGLLFSSTTSTRTSSTACCYCR